LGIESITIRYSFNGNFSESGTTTVNGGTTWSGSLVESSSGQPPGTVTVYVRAEKAGFVTSSTASQTETLSICASQ
jgi:hypothetical protein